MEKEFTVTFELSIIKKLIEQYSKDYPSMTFKDCKTNDKDNLLITFKYNLIPYTTDELYSFLKSPNFEESFFDKKNN